MTETFAAIPEGAAVVDRVRRVLGELHARHFVHLDLHQKLNVLIGPEGGAWLIDLGQGVDCSGPVLRRLLFPLLRRVDRRATLKFRARYAPETLPGNVSRKRVDRLARRRGRGWKEFHRRLRRRLLGQR